jgi:uncharacterized membrane protein YphA (DoxX/SURF4 family)
MDYSRPPATPTARELGYALLRLAVGVSLIVYHALGEVMTGWRHLWSQMPWPYAQSLAESNFPLPVVLAVISVVGALTFSVFLLIGFLTRVSAIALAAGALVALFLYLGWPDIREKISLYLAVYVVLVIVGPDRFTLDAALGGNRNQRRIHGR